MSRRQIMRGSSFFLALAAAVAPRTAIAEDPPAAPGAIAVPEEQARFGTVFYVRSSDKPQVTFTSKAKAEEFKGTSNDMEGYLVVPRGESNLPVEFVGGEFRVPVVSLDTGNKQRDQHLQDKRWLDAATYPEVTFKVAKVSNPKLIKKGDESSLYKVTLAGPMTIMGSSKDISVDVTVTIAAESEATKKTGPGDIMTVKGKFPVTLADYKVAVNDEAVTAGKVAKTMQIDVNLTLSSAKPGT